MTNKLLEAAGPELREELKTQVVCEFVMFINPFVLGLSILCIVCPFVYYSSIHILSITSFLFVHLLLFSFFSKLQCQFSTDNYNT